ncbi:1,6-anhydro-N-acetylmuramyl-L-alanine amidase AmpD [Pseudomonadota bacterium]|uniref:1,6-anhydro-N-acetylmuramyl-L-alanine amidase AmpD n=1 Tax=unclassified Shewanella TaxID=196818 RepID=UPI000C8602FE|nr:MULTISPECIES: 1,6-anhydro-N-acetylmuramyl-L-alanine amidase AmpD [unclassified Shewanella]MDO6618685.1 1,6-anhydro-N-acetylmuramyl-L-alanine amidase AmpD [Shewanella sp. 6_MG-2023]MDO6639872.1 1,6-anhydro-N-acetylmuramyl-L-alanine amidase AmpD [Shewanella sp. 5_MG-2023]MDO6775430.1 1,6-anhydro-N-acetylmuramyl-L-alanine amidase AmpD [Shewanella sp. 3_MG-2023]PMG31914.1 N-acetyl-anhydromuranmyl-L-alanine amidase [Shewanella sp. 10N.286.52.C2]PMH85346.1 N-acetyl-anhydromuranmyl-L-alanine amida
MDTQLKSGWHQGARLCPSPHFNPRPNNEVSGLVIHNISLPAGCYGLPHIDGLFQGCLAVDADPSFADIAGLEVSAHFLIRRDGELVQYVSCDDRAWHAGVSCFNGREGCNDFTIGIEMEGTDSDPYTDAQYRELVQLTLVLFAQYPMLNQANIVGHCDIAPGRKTDPGDSFDWQRYLTALTAKS